MDDEHINAARNQEGDIELSLAIPFYNEAPNISYVLDEIVVTLDDAGIAFEILAVNNGSRDDTGPFIDAYGEKEPRVVPIHVEKNLGYGNGILRGLGRTKGAYCGYTWGDGQVKAKDLLRIFTALKSTGADLSKALRVTRHDGFFRLVQTRCYFIVFLLLFWWPQKDPNGCPKLFIRESFERINPKSKDWLLDPEILIKAKKLKMKVVHTPVVFNKRERGKSKVNLMTTISFFWGLLKMRFLPWD